MSTMTAYELATLLKDAAEDGTSAHGIRVSVRIEIGAVALFGFKDGCCSQHLVLFEDLIGSTAPRALLANHIAGIRASILAALAV